MARFFKKLAERFKPGIFERLKQGSEAKKKKSEPPQYPYPAQVHDERLIAVDTETTPTGGVLVRAQIQIYSGYDNTATTTGWDVKRNADTVWRMWHTDNNITACTTYNDPWQQWHNCGTTSSNVITVTNAWRSWASEAEDRYTTRKMSKAERQRREEEERRWRAEEQARRDRETAAMQEQEAKRKAADDRAMGLLISMLSQEQKNDLKNHQHFFVKAASGRLYRIDQGSHGNVKVVDSLSRKVIERLCVQPDGVPAGDSMLMQKLLIETAEVALRKHANITLNDGTVLRGDPSLLTGEKLAQIIPLRKAA